MSLSICIASRHRWRHPIVLAILTSVLASAAGIGRAPVSAADNVRSVQSAGDSLRRTTAQDGNLPRHLRHSGEAPRPAVSLPISADAFRLPAPDPAVRNARPAAPDNLLYFLDRSPAPGHPKLIVHVTARTLLDQLNQYRTDLNPVDDVILGTQLRGTALTQTHVTPRLIPNDQAIQIALNLQTLAHTKTTGTNSAATAHSLGTTRIIGCKTIYFTASQAHTTPARTMADVTSEIVSFHWGRLFGARIARQRADEQKPLTEQISAQRAEDRASAQFDRQVTQQLDRLARSFRQSMNARIASMPIQPTHLRLRSTTDAVIGDAWFDHGIVTAWPPGLNVRGSQQGVAVQVHQSLLVQTLESLNRSLAGQALDEQQLSQFGNVLSDASGGRSASPRPQRRSRREWTLKMAETRPIQIRITGQGIHVSLNMDSITIDEVPNPPMRVQAVYLPVIRNQACYLERQGRLSLTPVTERQQADGNDSALQKGERTGTAAPPTQRRGARQQVFQSLLRKRFEQVMVPSLSLGPQYRSIDGNSITLTNIDLSDEWITIQAIPR